MCKNDWDTNKLCTVNDYYMCIMLCVMRHVLAHKTVKTYHCIPDIAGQVRLHVKCGDTASDIEDCTVTLNTYTVCADTVNILCSDPGNRIFDSIYI